MEQENAKACKFQGFMVVTVLFFSYIVYRVVKKIHNKIRNSRKNVPVPQGRREDSFHNIVNNFKNEYSELKKSQESLMKSIANKITQDKAELLDFVVNIKEQQRYASFDVIRHLEQTTTTVSQTILQALDQEHLKNDQHFERTNRIIDDMREDVHTLKNVILTNPLKPEATMPTIKLLKSCFTQTECLMKKRSRDIHKEVVTECSYKMRDQIKNIPEGEKLEHLKKIYSYLHEDRQIIRDHITQAFRDQEQLIQNYFSCINIFGKKAVKSIEQLKTVFSEQLQKIESSVNYIPEFLNRQEDQMNNVTKALNEAKYKFDDFTTKVESLCQQKDTNEITNLLLGLKDNFESNSTKLEDILKTLSTDKIILKNVVHDMGELKVSKEVKTVRKKERLFKPAVGLNDNRYEDPFSETRLQSANPLSKLSTLNESNRLTTYLSQCTHKARGIYDILLKIMNNFSKFQSTLDVVNAIDLSLYNISRYSERVEQFFIEFNNRVNAERGSNSTITSLDEPEPTMKCCQNYSGDITTLRKQSIPKPKAGAIGMTCDSEKSISLLAKNILLNALDNKSFDAPEAGDKGNDGSSKKVNNAKTQHCMKVPKKERHTEYPVKDTNSWGNITKKSYNEEACSKTVVSLTDESTTEV